MAAATGGAAQGPDKVMGRWQYRLVPAPLYLRWRYWRRARRKYRDEEELRLLPFLVDPDRVAIDVGANKGMYTYPLQQLAKRVIAYEPNRWLAAFLRRACAPHVDVREAAVANQDGTVSFFIPVDPDGELHHNVGQLSNKEMSAAREEPVECVRLDTEDPGPVGFIKIDVEGGELEVLMGAEKIIARDKPILLVEILTLRKGEPSPAVAWLLERGYSAFAYGGKTLRPLGLVPVEARGRNYVFFPPA